MILIFRFKTFEWIDVDCRSTMRITGTDDLFVIDDELEGSGVPPTNSFTRYMTSANGTEEIRILGRVFSYTACVAPPDPDLDVCNGVRLRLQTNEDGGGWNNYPSGTSTPNKLVTDNVDYEPEGSKYVIFNKTVILPQGVRTAIRMQLKKDHRVGEICVAFANYGVNYRRNNWLKNNNTPIVENATITALDEFDETINLTCDYDYFDLDGDLENITEGGTYFNWTINDVNLTDYNHQNLSFEKTSAGDNITCSVTGFDQVFKTRNESGNLTSEITLLNSLRNIDNPASGLGASIKESPLEPLLKVFRLDNVWQINAILLWAMTLLLLIHVYMIKEGK